MSQAVSNNSFRSLPKNPLSEYQSNKNICANITSKISIYTSNILPVIGKVFAVAAEGALVGGLLASSGAQTAEIGSETRVIEAVTGMRTTTIGIVMLITAAAISGVEAALDTKKSELKTKTATVAIATTIFGAVAGMVAGIATKQWGAGNAFAIVMLGSVLVGPFTGIIAWARGDATPETAYAFGKAFTISAALAGLGASAIEESGKDAIFVNGAVVGALFGFGMRIMKIFLLEERHSIATAISVANERLSRNTNLPFFRALLTNYLNTLRTHAAKEEFLINLQARVPHTVSLFAINYVEQLLQIKEELTVENTPDFFHENRTIGNEEKTLLEAINALKKVLEAKKKTRESLAKEEEKAPMDFPRRDASPERDLDISRKISAIANCLINAREINAEGLRINPTMPSRKEVAQFRADCFGPSIRIV